MSMHSPPTSLNRSSAPLRSAALLHPLSLLLLLSLPLVQALPVRQAGPAAGAGSANALNPDDVFRPASERHRMFTHQREASSCGYVGQGAAAARKPARSFLMVFMGHSGSSAIMSELWQHPKVLIEQPEAVDHGDLQFNSSAALAFTRAFFSRAEAGGRMGGFKIRPWHILQAPHKWATLARDFDTRVIWQYRKNVLKQSVGEYSYKVFKDDSIVEGLRSKDEVKKRCDVGAGCRFAVTDYDLFHTMLKESALADWQIATAASFLSKDTACVHELPYEDYLYHRAGTMLDLYHFLGIPPTQAAPQRFKATGDNMCQVVANWNDLCARFYGCATWRRHFEDEANGCSCRFTTSPKKYCDATPPIRRR